MEPQDSAAFQAVEEPAIGLTEAEAAARLSRDGFNDLPALERRSAFGIVKDVVREPMFGLLLGAGGLYALIGDLAEALVLFAFATASVSIAIIQRGRSERVLEALRDLTSPRALVLRSGERRRIPGREVVCGDVSIVTEGDRVPADAVLISGDDIRVDESLLTGESVPAYKHSMANAVTASTGDHSVHLYSGTLIVRGTGQAVVTATGARTEIGKIGGALSAIDAEPPRLHAQTRRLVLFFAVAGLSLSALAVVLYGLLRGDWLQAFLAGIALGMSLLPEEFPLVLTVFMVMGAWRLSQSRVLTRRAAAIETLGAATVLCTDKTGTLTRNAMSVVRLKSANGEWSAGEDPTSIAGSSALSTLLGAAVLASDCEALDPMERALHELAATARVETPRFGPLIRVYPLRPQRPAVTNVYAQPGDEACAVVAKGAPEAIAKMCGMNPHEIVLLTDSVNALAREGIRVLGVAHGRHPRSGLSASPDNLTLQYLGLVGLADPLRPTVFDAVSECRTAGIRVMMITGDYPETARAIARQAGIDDGEVSSGVELDRLDDAALAAHVRTVTVFARITPQQKLRIVEALKANGEIVAMTGDGVNDAPALKSAHIGIAMGGRGTDVAREASSLVLLDDDFGSIVRAIRLGRRIYDNLRKAMSFILAIHVPIAGLALLPLLLGGPLVLTPLLIAFLELIIDPACSVVFEAEREEQDVMSRPPRNPRTPLISSSFAGWSVLQGALALALVTAVFVYAMRKSMPNDEVRALTFVTLVGINVALIFVNRSFHAVPRAVLGWTNRSLWWGLAMVVLLVALTLRWPVARTFLGLGPLHADDLLLCLGVAIVLLIALQSAKLLWGSRLRA